MKALLVRVGIDLSVESGHWNAPVNSENEFAYVPILQTEEVIPEYRIGYEGFFEPCERLGKRLDKKFASKTPHLDPDFCYLTYGDIDEPNGTKHKGRPLLDLYENDLLVFYASLDPGRWKNAKLELVYAIIGLYVIEKKPMRATDIPNIDSIRHKNAHLRRDYKKKDIIVFAKPAPLSGRLEKCIRIGECKNGRYWLQQNLFDEWGGFLHRNRLYLQRMPVLTSFDNAEKFYKWFKKNQKTPLVASNY